MQNEKIIQLTNQLKNNHCSTKDKCVVMEDKNNKSIPPNISGGNPQRKGPKFNLYWIYGLFAAAILIFNIWGKDMGGKMAKELSFQTINREYIKKKLVDSLVVLNRTVEVYLKKDSLKSPAYAPLLKSLNNNLKGPHFTFTIGNIDQFNQDLKLAQQEYQADDQFIKVTYTEDTKSGVVSFIIQFILPIVVMVGLWGIDHAKNGWRCTRRGRRYFQYWKVKSTIV
jgi:FtsH Extracellular.